MSLIDEAGLIGKFDEESEEIFDKLVRTANLFLRSGLTWTEWRSMRTIEKKAFIRAGDQLDRERAAYSGIASQGLEDIYRLLKDQDGGEMLLDYQFKREVQRIHDKYAVGVNGG